MTGARGPGAALLFLAACGGGGESWEQQPAPAEPSGFTAIWVFAPDDVWLSGQAVHHWDGESWTRVSIPSGGGVDDLWGVAPNELWGVSAAGVVHWDGSAWNDVPYDAVAPSGAMRAIWAGAPYDVWVGGDGGEALHWDGSMWTSQATGAGDITDVWGSGSGELWVTGREAVARWDGSTWAYFGDTSGLADPQTALWGFAANDVFFAGAGNVIQHYDGMFISGQGITDGELVQDYDSIWGSSHADLWAVGIGGVIAHFDGESWSFHRTGADDHHQLVFGSSAGDVWVAGRHSSELVPEVVHGP